MGIVEHIRKEILEMSQSSFAAIANVNQATVSRWERGELSPDLDQLGAIRAEVLKRDLPWNDGWLFDVPSREAAE